MALWIDIKQNLYTIVVKTTKMATPYTATVSVTTGLSGQPGDVFTILVQGSFLGTNGTGVTNLVFIDSQQSKTILLEPLTNYFISLNPPILEIDVFVPAGAAAGSATITLDGPAVVNVSITPALFTVINATVFGGPSGFQMVPSSGPPGQATQLNANNCFSSTAYRIEVRDSTNALRATYVATSSATGSFLVTNPIPQTGFPLGMATVTVNNTATATQAGVVTYNVAVSPFMGISPLFGTAGTSNAVVSGYNLTPSTPYTVKIVDASSATILTIANVMTSSAGALSTILTVPAIAALGDAVVSIWTSGGSPVQVTQTLFTVTTPPVVSVYPPFGVANTQVQVVVAHLNSIDVSNPDIYAYAIANPVAPYTLTFTDASGGGSPLYTTSTLYTDATGKLTTSFYVPTGAHLGAGKIAVWCTAAAAGGARKLLEVPFTVVASLASSVPTMSLTPTTGTVGASVSVLASNLSATTSYTLTFVDTAGTTGISQVVTSDGSGTVSTTITVPAGGHAGTAYVTLVGVAPAPVQPVVNATFVIRDGSQPAPVITIVPPAMGPASSTISASVTGLAVYTQYYAAFVDSTSTPTFFGPVFSDGSGHIASLVVPVSTAGVVQANPGPGFLVLFDQLSLVEPIAGATYSVTSPTSPYMTIAPTSGATGSSTNVTVYGLSTAMGVQYTLTYIDASAVEYPLQTFSASGSLGKAALVVVVPVEAALGLGSMVVRTVSMPVTEVVRGGFTVVVPPTAKASLAIAPSSVAFLGRPAQFDVGNISQIGVLIFSAVDASGKLVYYLPFLTSGQLLQSTAFSIPYGAQTGVASAVLNSTATAEPVATTQFTILVAIPQRSVILVSGHGHVLLYDSNSGSSLFGNASKDAYFYSPTQPPIPQVSGFVDKLLNL